MRTIAQEWEQFRKAAMPETAPDYQIRDMETAFYAGYISLLATCDDIAKSKMSFEEMAKEYAFIAGRGQRVFPEI